MTTSEKDRNLIVATCPNCQRKYTVDDESERNYFCSVDCYVENDIKLEELRKNAKELFNSSKTPLAFLVKSNVNMEALK